jgi:CTP:molybdopterin cytidylyltransferase MocA
VIAGLVLAAGAGTRYGEGSKLLAELGGRPLVEHAIQAQCAVPELERVVVVLGARAQEILGAVDFGRAETVVCPDWQLGQAASLRAGAQVLSAAGADRVLITLGDEPLLTAALISRFVREPPPARAVYAGRPGHPVVLGPEQIAALGTLTGDRGARDLLAGASTIECAHLGSGRDVDTPDDLEEIRHEARTII